MSTDLDQHTVVKFHPKQVPTIACVNMATDIGVNWTRLIEALNEYVKVLAPIWGTPANVIDADCGLPSLRGIPRNELLEKLSERLKGRWGMLFLDDADEPHALGYHDLTHEGLPLSKVFVRARPDKVSVTASHELAEMLVDPGIQMGAFGTDGRTWYAYEVADAVEGEEAKLRDFLNTPMSNLEGEKSKLHQDILNTPMSNFVYPAWFEGFRAPYSTRFDHLGKCKRPFELLPSGYMPVFQNGKWTAKFGSQAEEGFNRTHHPRMRVRPHQMRMTMPPEGGNR
jgi:hypothetical protein